MSGRTNEEKAILLKKGLGPEFVNSRPGAGGSKVMYMTGDVVINLANEVFGYNGWSSEIKSYHLDYQEQTEQGRYNVGISTVVRVTIKEGSFHEDIGFGAVENARSKDAAFALARKQSATDALKRTLRKFGNLLGNCLYDKSYLNQLSTMAKPSKRYASDDIYRFQNQHTQQQQQQNNNKKLKLEQDQDKHKIKIESMNKNVNTKLSVPSPSPTSSATTNTLSLLIKKSSSPPPSGPNPAAAPSSPSLLISEDSFVIDEDDEFYANLADGAYNDEELGIDTSDE
ncbi:Rad52/22 family double-strand break repair protein-domain-containing protein [Cunninghamella echinulata]|nr:Rad52/22 family double-strand break repair protein-domain-containing protein [Cunninghamella echinulata]